MEEKGKENVPKKDRIDTLLERKKANMSTLVDKKRVDPTLVSKLQGQITTTNSKLTDVNHRCNLLEQKNKQVEEKCQKLVDSNKSLSENFEKKDKELKNLATKLGYALKEKQTFEEKLKESKAYINKLEQRILRNTKGTSQTYQTSDTNIYGTFETDENMKDFDTIQLKEIIENQKYEIKLLTQALNEKELQGNGSREKSFSSNQNILGRSFERLETNPQERVDRRVFDKVKRDYENLYTQFEELQEELAQLKRGNEYTNKKSHLDEGSYNKINREMDSLRNEKDEVENEKNSLHQYVEELNQKIKQLTSENLRLKKEKEDIHLSHLAEQTRLKHDLDTKDLEIKHLNNILNQEKQKTREMEQKLEKEIENTKMVFEEREKSRQMDEINELLRGEINKLTEIIKAYEEEAEFYKEETEKLKIDKDNLRAGLEEFIKRNSTIEQSLNSGEKIDLSNLQTSKMLDELEQVEIERRRLKESLNQTLNELNSYKEKERDFEDVLRKKEKQIENLINSRTMMQNTLGDQVLVKEKENKRLKDEFSRIKEDMEALREENKFIRDLLRKQEKYMNDYSGSDRSKI